MMSAVKRSLWSLALVALFGFGCVTPPSGIETRDGVEQDDIPVPTGFNFDRSESYDQEIPVATDFRSWTGVYVGPGH